MSCGNDSGLIQSSSSSTEVSTKVKGNCNVCGDKAFYNFYGSLACDSCRTFFRRQVLQKKELYCENGSTCVVNFKTRKECSKCRLSKCYAAGMRMELVAPNEEQRIRRGRSTNVDRLNSRTQEILGAEAQPIAPTNSGWSTDQANDEAWSSKNTTASYEIGQTGSENQGNQYQYVEQDQSSQVACTTSRSGFACDLPESPHLILCSLDQVSRDNSKGHMSVTVISSQSKSVILDDDEVLTPNLRYLEKLPKFRKYAQRMCSIIPNRDGQLCQIVPFSPNCLDVSPSPIQIPPISKIRAGLSGVGQRMVGNISSTAILSTDTVEAVSDSLSTLCITDSITFQGILIAKLMDEILIASNILTGRYYEIVASRNNEVVCATKLLYFGIQRVLQSCRSFSYFRELSRGDQEILIKESCTEMLLLRSLYHVNLELDAWIFYSPATGFQVKRTTRLYIKILKKVQKNINLYKAYHDLTHGIDQMLRGDNLLLTIMMAMILFSPDRNNLPKDHKFKYVQKLYSCMLKNYLDSRMGEIESKKIFVKLVQLLVQLRSLREDYEKGTLNLSIDDLRGLTETFYELSI